MSGKSYKAHRLFYKWLFDPATLKQTAYKPLWTRVFDLAFSVFILLPVAVACFPFVALLIKATSGGPVFFIQKRTGAGKSVFNCYKFRTIYLNSVSETHQATHQDPRLTPVGYFLRVMHIDELPQIINVIRGDMSLVGPRPHMLYHTFTYSEDIPWYDARLLGKPGLTGLAQVNGFLGEIKSNRDIRKRIILDAYYIKNASPVFYLAILSRSVGVLLSRIAGFFSSKQEESQPVRCRPETVHTE